MDSATREQLKHLAFRAGVGERLRQVKRAFEPAETTRDRADIDHLRAILGAVLTPASNCIDIGAHEGLFLGDIVRLAPRGRHIAYEPLPHLAEQLAQRFPGVDVRARAVSDHAGEAEFVHVVTRPGWSGFRERPYPGAETLRRFTVGTESLDAALEPDYVPHFIKIDVEGAEQEVLRGAADTIRRHRPLVALEHGLGSAEYYGTRPEAIHAMLTDGTGLAIFDLDGGGPYSAGRFTRTFERHECVNFLARPYEA
jgi:FkbM family methyltransferase